MMETSCQTHVIWQPPWLNSLALGKFEWNFRCNFQTDFSDWWLRHHLWNCPNMNVTGERERERVIKFIGLFGDRGHRGPYSPYKPCNHNLYIGIIIFPHIDNPQSTGYNWSKKKTIKIINEKSGGPINLTNHWRKRLWISWHVDLKRLN